MKTGRALILLPLLCAACTPLRPTHELGDGNRYAIAAAFSLDKQFVAAADTTGLVRIWSARTGQEFRRCPGYAAAYPIYGKQSLTFSPEGNRIAFAGSDGSVRVWNWRDDHVDKLL